MKRNKQGLDISTGYVAKLLVLIQNSFVFRQKIGYFNVMHYFEFMSLTGSVSMQQRTISRFSSETSNDFAKKG